MSAWIISLPTLLGMGLTVSITIGVGIGVYLLIRQIPAGIYNESSTKVADHIRRVVGVLLGLMLSTVFAFSNTRALKIQDSVEVEAAQLADLHHDLSRIRSEISDPIQQQISEYLELVVSDEWPMLAAGNESETTNRMFLRIEDGLLALPVQNEYERQIKSRLLVDIDEISDLRQARVYSAGSGLDWYIVMVILSFVFLMTTFRFYDANRWTFFYLVSYAVLIGIVLYLTVAQNYPFRSGRVSPQPFESLSHTIADSQAN